MTDDFYALKAISKGQIIEQNLEKHTVQEKAVLQLVNKATETVGAWLEGKRTDWKNTSSPATAGCAHCGKRHPNLKRCTRCRAVSYCNRDCQSAHFNAHKKQCKRIAASRTSC